MDPINRLCQNMYISAPTISQYAAMEAFNATEELDKRKDIYIENLRLLKEGLPKAGFTNFIVADGAFYLFCNVENITDNSEELCKEILNNAKVAITPGLYINKLLVLLI